MSDPIFPNKIQLPDGTWDMAATGFRVYSPSGYIPAPEKPMAKQELKQEEPRNLTCPSCGHDRFQRHERGKFDNAGRFTVDEIAVQCLKCLGVFLLDQLVK